ncbi:hypothetical protein EBU24_07055 [bacterium]|nr:hypothetical protein [bacterium]
MNRKKITMSDKALLQSYKQTADLHAQRMTTAFKNVHHLFPLTVETIKNLQDVDIAWLDSATGRFSKLQDLISAKIFPLLIKILGQEIPLQTFIDKLNKLEKLDFLPSADDWSDMRDIRNLLAHDYPETEDEIAKELTKIFKIINELNEYWQELREKLATVIEQMK